MMYSEKTIQNKLYQEFIKRQHDYIIPNSYVLNNGSEADLITVTKSGYINEIEIKISKQDWKNDFKKPKFKLYKLDYKERRYKKNIEKYGYRCPNYFYYAVPKELYDTSSDIIKCIPDYVGIIIVSNNGYVDVLKKAKIMHKYKINENQKHKISRGLVYRYWNLRNENES